MNLIYGHWFKGNAFLKLSHVRVPGRLKYPFFFGFIPRSIFLAGGRSGFA